MKSLAILSLASLLLAGTAWAGTRCHESQRLITVTGTGEITANPDVAVIQIGVTTEAQTAKRCYSENNKIMQAVRESLLRLGIEKDDIQTTRFNLSPRYEYPGGGVRKFIGYQMNHMYTVKVRDFDILGDALDAATKAGANEISTISFVIDDPQELEAEAREAAVKDAEARATALAEAAGAELVRVHSISEGAGPFPQPIAEYREMKASAAAPVEPGTRKVVVNVNVVYEIE